MSFLLVYADAVPTDVVDVLDMSGTQWKAVSSNSAAERLEPEEGWSGAFVIADEPESALAFCRSLKRSDDPVTPVLLAINAAHLSAFGSSEQLFDDFILLPLRKEELEVRLARMLWRDSGGAKPNTVEYGAILLNLSTYQAAVSGRPLDMTYMEYELLRHFVMNPARVFSREELLRTVWGYEYYGGARTVDVHVRRLRAKLGDEHAALIQTVRSVGYIFGRTRWAG